MSRFTTRVELYGSPSSEHYESLHAAMEEKQLQRFIATGDNKAYWLPHAEYTYSGALTIKQVLELAKQAAASVWKDFAVLVTHTEVAREWHNLKEKNKPDAMFKM